jgi:thiamine pyrophosphate-dependent acetolactate synthase large subunit-like protein
MTQGLDRRAVVAELLREPGDCPGGQLLVVTGLGSTTYDAGAAGDRPENFYLWGAMGGAAMIGLGVALAQPERRVLVLTGDGEALMGMGALSTLPPSETSIQDCFLSLWGFYKFYCFEKFSVA